MGKILKEVFIVKDITLVGVAKTIDLQSAPDVKKFRNFKSMSIVWTGGTAPTTSENLLVKIDRTGSSGYDEILFNQDASTWEGGIVNFRYDEGEVALNKGDVVSVEYPNSDDLAVECSITTVLR